MVVRICASTDAWTFQLYAFVLGYAFLIYLIWTILFPSDLGDHQGFISSLAGTCFSECSSR